MEARETGGHGVDYIICDHRLVVRSRLFQGRYTSSNLVGRTNAPVSQW